LILKGKNKIYYYYDDCQGGRSRGPVLDHYKNVLVVVLFKELT